MGSAVPQELIGQTVVVDTSSQMLYIGLLKSADDHFLTIENADVHDSSESATSKEVYLIESKKYGIKVNRKWAYVKANTVVSISRLEDVIEY
jgi:small nuclear ribonucleoprotein (snRNP)-like protein